MNVVEKTLRATEADFIPTESIDEQDWHTSVIQNLLQLSSTVATKELKEFTLSTTSYRFEAVLEF